MLLSIVRGLVLWGIKEGTKTDFLASGIATIMLAFSRTLGQGLFSSFLRLLSSVKGSSGV